MTDEIAAPARPRVPGRIVAIDAARGLALVAMAIYHFAWDLEFFSYAPPGMTAVGGWKLFARSIASSFLLLVGVSLFLAHGDRMRWAGYWRRLAMVAGAAALITVATWFATPDTFIFFGILHQIAFASLAGLMFLRLPWAATLALGVACVAASYLLRTPALDAPWWWWSGLSATPPRSNDYVPVFPWFGAVLIGIALGRLLVSSGIAARLAALQLPKAADWLAVAGRHSLLVYLVHQPVLIAGLYLFSLAMPPAASAPTARFTRACEASCGESRSAAFCSPYCACALEKIEAEDMLDSLFSDGQDAATQTRMEEIAQICTATTIERREGESP